MKKFLSAIQVNGLIESLLNGFKFPDATIQTTAGQPLNVNLTGLAGLTSAVDKISYFTGTGGASALASFNNAGRTFLNATSVSAQRTALALGTVATQNVGAIAFTGGAIDGTTLGATTPSSAKVTSFDFSGNITASGSAQRFIADFTNAATTNRTYFQTSTANSTTSVGVLPNGTSQNANIICLNNSDGTNGATIVLAAGPSSVNLNSGSRGSGTVLPLAINVNGGDAINVSTAQNVGMGVTSPTTDCKLQVSNGVKVGNTANANSAVFDYYDEPTWTVVAKGTTTAGTGTPVGTPVGKSNRKGDEVTIFMDLQVSAHTGTGNLKFGDLPFTSVAGLRTPLNFSAVGLVITAGNRLEAFIAAGATEITVQQVTALGVASAVPMPAGAATYLISGSYKAA